MIETIKDLIMEKDAIVLDIAQARQIHLALALCRELIVCPATSNVERQEVVREIRAAQEILLANDERVAAQGKARNDLLEVENV